MESQSRSVKEKLGLLRLAGKLGSVTQACDTLGYSRDSYYRFKNLFEKGGADALRDISRRKPLLKNRVHPTVEQAVLAETFAHPEHGQQRVAADLARRGVAVSSSGVRSIWVRRGIETCDKRVFAILAMQRQDGAALTSEQEAAVERARKAGKLKHGTFIERPGEVCYHDLTTMGAHPRLGPLYLMSYVDAYSHYAFAMVTTDPAANPALFRRQQVQPWFAARKMTIGTIRTDRRPPFADAGRLGYRHGLKADDIRHTYRLTKGAQRSDAGLDFIALVEREVFQPFFRCAPDASLERLEGHLAQWLTDFNQQRPWQGPSCFGKSPLATFESALRPET